MRTLIALFSIFGLVSLAAAGTGIQSAKLDASGKNIVLSVVHGGGCGSHDFSLKMGEYCLESLPLQCSAELIHKTDDFCEALISSEVVLPLADYGLDGEYFSYGTILRISYGDSSATVSLPRTR